MTIYLSGAINLVSQEEIQREADLYAQNGWEYRDPTTHKVSVQIAQRDIEAFCDYLRSRPADRRPKVWRDRDGNEHQEETVTFYLNGSEMTGTWIRLRSALKITHGGDQSAGAPASQPARRVPAPAPVRRAAAAPPQAAVSPSDPVAGPPATPDRPPVWTSAPLDPEDDDDDIPF